MRISDWSSDVCSSDLPHMVPPQIFKAAEIIEDCPGDRVCRQGVESEVPSRRILAPVIGKRYGRPPPVGRDIAAQRRHLHHEIGCDGGDRAVIYARRHRLQTRRLQPFDPLPRLEAGGEVHIRYLQPDPAVATSPYRTRVAEGKGE